jgi:hypothetical protein
MNYRTIATTAKLITVIAVISLVSCKKDGVSTNSNESNAANLSDSSAAAESTYYDVLNNAFVGFSDNSSVFNTSSPHSGKTTTFSTGVENTATNLGCAIYTISDSVPGEYPKTLTLDFGTGCTSADGIMRKGKLVYVFSDNIFSPGATAAVTFDQYVVNGYGILGTYSITNNSSEIIGVSISTQVTNGIITYPNQTNYHYSGNRSYLMTAGIATPFDITDDVYSVTGNSSFSNSYGATLVCNISTPLVKPVICHNVTAGVISFVYDDVVNGTLDFGDGTCDNQATLKIGANFTKTITLP